MIRPLQDRIAEADMNSGMYLAKFNELDERGLGDTKKAQALLLKSQTWLDRLNKLLGNN